MSIIGFRRKSKSKNKPKCHSSDCDGDGVLALRPSVATSSATSITSQELDHLTSDIGLTLLRSPENPQVDLVFVHGLGGSSKKTWSKDGLQSHFWPVEWLSQDPAFENARIHTYGYHSHWMKDKDNCLDLHHIGKGLTGELATSPSIRGSKTPLIFLGHSMGGLIIKKAYIFARQDPSLMDLASRFHAIYFFATPHRGSDSAKLLDTVLQAASLSRGYIADLSRGSRSLQATNDDFRQFSTDLALWSFYETQKMSARGFSFLIIDPESATLGYPGERQMPMNADHRSICKFESPSDPNYLIVRNSLAMTINQASTVFPEDQTASIDSAALESIASYLGVDAYHLEDDLSTLQEARIHGTCHWLKEKNSYLKWRDSDIKSPLVLSITGSPAAGKSVLAGYGIDDLAEQGLMHSFFFFSHSDTSKSRMSVCLRSLAYQMACMDDNVLARLMVLKRKNARLELENERVIWRTVFDLSILTNLRSRHYWVIDGLDECSGPELFLTSMLARLGQRVPLRILITSRKNPELDKGMLSLGMERLLSEHIEADTTCLDMKRLITARIQDMMIGDERFKQELSEKLMQKASGSFLWTSLVMEELTQCYSEEDVTQVLDEIPLRMELLYQRILDSMSKLSRGKHLARAILLWTVSVRRLLKVAELQNALEWDMGTKFPNLRNSISALCGQLVVVDRNERVHTVHESVRAFFLSEQPDSEFAFTRLEADTRIAQACLTYLTSDEMRPPRTGSWMVGKAKASARSLFNTYACSDFSSHLAAANSASEDLLALVGKFFKSNILSWIECIAKSSHLGEMVHVSRQLEVYHNACVTEMSPLTPDLRSLRTWSTDLQRIAAKFSDALVKCPSAIYSLIIPFCPTLSPIQDIAVQGRKMLISGIPNVQWDDRLICIDFREVKPRALAYGEECFAVGLSNGQVHLFHSHSGQHFRTLELTEPVGFVEFARDSDKVAVSGTRTARLWSWKTGLLLQDFVLPQRQRCIGIAFDGNAFLIVTQKSELLFWNSVDEGSMPQKQIWTQWPHNGVPCPKNKVPGAISVGVAHNAIAVAYAGLPVLILDIDQQLISGFCGKKLGNGRTSTHPVTALLFNPNSDIALLAISYLDGELAIVDPFNDALIEKQHLNCHSLAASADGRLLAGTAGAGAIQVFLFDTLQLLYKVVASNVYVKQLAFSIDGLLFADIRDRYCNVWKPPILLTSTADDDPSVSTASALIEWESSAEKCISITAMTVLPGALGIICGKTDGSVCMYGQDSGDLQTTLYTHKSPVRALTWITGLHCVISVCVFNVVQVWSIKDISTQVESKAAKLQESELPCTATATSVVAAKACGSFVIPTRTSDRFCTVEAGETSFQDYPETERASLWAQSPSSDDHVLCFRESIISLYRWSDWSILATAQLDGLFNEHKLHRTLPFSHNRVIVELGSRDHSTDTRDVRVVKIAPFSRTTSPVQLAGQNTDTSRLSQLTPKLGPVFVSLGPVGQQVVHIIGIEPTGRMVYLDRSSWVCSINLNNLPAHTYTRHFFIPVDWFAGTGDILTAIHEKTIIVAKHGDVAIISGGLAFAEEMAV